MKTRNLFCSLFIVALAISLASCATEEKKEAKLEAKAKLSKAEAERIALTKVPGGTVKEGEIEKEKGKLIWSFDIATPGTQDVTEVAVDAITGDVVSVENETPGQEAKEKTRKDVK